MEPFSPAALVVGLGRSPARGTGLTMVIDKGLGLAGTRDLMEMAAPYMDLIKLASARHCCTRPLLAGKCRVIRAAGVEVYPGGTLLEAAVHQGKAPQFLIWAAQAGFTGIEVSEGTIDLAPGCGGI